MHNATSNGTDWTGVALTIGDVSHDLALDTILLSCEGEGAVGRGVELCDGASEHVGNMEVTNFDLHIFKPEGMLGIPSGVSILART